MVVESVISGIEAEKRPYMLALFGFALTVLSIFVASTIWQDQVSLVFLFFVVLGSIPIMYNVIKLEEKKDISDFHEVALLKEHWKALLAFMALFSGILLSVTAWYVFAPIAIFLGLFCVGELVFLMTKKNRFIALIIFSIMGIFLGFLFQQSEFSLGVHEVFKNQISTVNSIQTQAQITGKVSTKLNDFSSIFFNNIKVLMFCVLFSFVYGAGAIFILTWNASVIGVAIGNEIRKGLAEVANLVGLEKVGEYFTSVSYGLLRYVLHGIPEILGYFVAALAGGIISVAVIKHDFKGKKFEHIVLDAADLLLLAIALIFIAGLLEVWVTPLLFPS